MSNNNGLPRSLGKAVRKGHVAGLYRVEVDKVVDFVDVGGAATFVALPVDGLPSKQLKIDQVVANLTFTAQDALIEATFGLEWAVGSAPTPDVTVPFVGTEQDMVDTQSETAVAGVVSTGRAAAPLTAPLYLANDGGASEVNLNMVIDAGDVDNDVTAQIRVFGTIDLILSAV